MTSWRRTVKLGEMAPGERLKGAIMTNAVAGTGVLLSGGQEIPVAYDLVESAPDGQYTAEGQIFGDAGAVRDVFRSGACRLRLETGHVAEAVLFDCDANGSAHAGISGPMPWD